MKILCVGPPGLKQITDPALMSYLVPGMAAAAGQAAEADCPESFLAHIATYIAF